MAESTSVLWVVGVECEVGEFASAAWVVVGNSAGVEVADDADGVALDDCGAEGLVPSAVIAALCRGASCPIGLGPMGGTPATLMPWVDGWASWGGADSHGCLRRWC